MKIWRNLTILGGGLAGSQAVIKCPAQWRSQPKILGGAKHFDFKRATVIGVWRRFSNHKTTRYARNVGSHGPLGSLWLLLMVLLIKQVHDKYFVNG